MSASENLEKQLRAKLSRSTGRAARRTTTTAQPATKEARRRHVKLLAGAAHSHMQYARDDVQAVLDERVDEDAGWQMIAKSTALALSSVYEASEAAVKSLRAELAEARAEVRSLREDRDNTAAKARKRADAGAMVGAGALSIRQVARNEKGRHVLAAVKSDGRTYSVSHDPVAQHWTCECGAFDCKHARAVQLCVYPCEVTARKGRDGVALAAAGACTIQMHERESALAEVIDGADKFVVSRSGLGGWGCSCGQTLNATCAHGDAVRFLTRDL